ncbi:hypothetical protein Slala02_50650 [Streptomyces lavendulae subsp. lavendulae]|nr:hypothetical protein Slala01_24770 [Streptomyces lavendulae subsp. lavendulae]GLX29245.1 hypothetical protein Slala02_50650 [Streptomyces lavendulae subsp. lavendulae]
MPTDHAPLLQEWHDGNHANARGIADMLGIPPETYAADPLALIPALQDYVDRAPLDEFEQSDWITFRCDLVSYLADVIIRRHGAAWRIADDPRHPRGYCHVLEARGQDGNIHRVDPLDVIALELREPRIEIVSMITTAEYTLHLCPEFLRAEAKTGNPPTPQLAAVMAELAALEDPKIRAVNERHGDDHGVNLTKLRAIAKRLKTQQDLARELWATDNSAARLLALLICRPKAYDRAELDTMLRGARTPKVHDWLVGNVVKKSPHAEELRRAWFADPDPVVASAGWALTTDRVAKKPEGLDLPGLLDLIETRMKDAPDRLQWAMNHCLAQIGIEHPEHRARAIAIGERLEVLKDYPTSPGCTSPYAPVWITEMVRRASAG